MADYVYLSNLDNAIISIIEESDSRMTANQVNEILMSRFRMDVGYKMVLRHLTSLTDHRYLNSVKIIGPTGGYTRYFSIERAVA